ncbi:DNRLRE domain-containing protein [bacterium]|nr:DNRLRE domain-containing protein [bacterium]
MNKNTIFFSLLILLVTVTSILAWAPRTHMEIIQLTRQYLDEGIFPDLYTFVDTYRGEIYSGSTFPDWALVVINDTISWHAHSMRFGNIYIEHLAEKYPDMTTNQAKRELAFCLGVLSHIYSDRIWHGGTGEHTALDEGMTQDATTEEIIEGSLDIIVAYEKSISSFSWYWPIETIIEVYELYGDSNVTEDMLTLGTTGLQATYSTVMATGYLSYIAAKALIPWTYDNHWDYYPGGIENCAALTALQMQRAWAIDVNMDYVYQRSHYNCGYQDTKDTHLLSYHPLNNAGGEDCLIASNDEGTGHGAILLQWEIDNFDTTLVEIDSAKIFLYYFGNTWGVYGDKPLSTYKVNRYWNEGDFEDGNSTTYLGATQSVGDNLACWTHSKYDINPWAIAGVDGVPLDRDIDYTDIQTFNDYTPEQEWYSWDVTSIVRAWNLPSLVNKGIILKEELNTGDGYIFFTSGESQQDFNHPVLVVFTSYRELGYSETDNNSVPTDYKTYAYPNPFNSTCYINSPQSGRLSIYNLKGKLIETLDEGEKQWTPGESAPSGIYLVRVEANNMETSIRVMYLK